MVRYNEENIEEFKNNFIMYNEEIIKSLDYINFEFKKIEEVLQTPKSTREIPKIIDSIDRDINKVNLYKEDYSNKIDFTKNRYSDSISKMNLMMGGK